MKFFVYTVIVLFVIPFQVTIIHSFPIGGRVPDVILVIVFLTGLWRGQIEATALGLVLGFLQDIFSGTMGWVNLMTKPLIGLSVGIFCQARISLTPWVISILLMITSFIYGLIVLLFLRVSPSQVDFWSAVRVVIFPQTLYDVVFGMIIVFFAFKLFPSPNHKVWNL